MIARFVAHRRAERAQDWPGGHERTRKRSGELRHKPNAYAPFPALHDERLALKPKLVCEARQQRSDGRKDAPPGHVRAHVGRERTPVDHHGDRSSGWE